MRRESTPTAVLEGGESGVFFALPSSGDDDEAVPEELSVRAGIDEDASSGSSRGRLGGRAGDECFKKA